MCNSSLFGKEFISKYGDTAIQLLTTDIFKYQILSDKFIKANRYLSNMVYRPNIEYMDEVLTYNQFLEEVANPNRVNAYIREARTFPTTKSPTRKSNDFKKNEEVTTKDDPKPVQSSIFQHVKNILNKL